ncbi:MAG TPA: DedA family protein [Clostridia bacterium]|nr:DedA family protein [Clostridia bacterium]
MQDWLINVINHYGYLGIAFLILLENVFPPIPSEIILTFSGFLTTISNTNIWLSSLSATLGSMAGAILLYMLGRVLPQRKIAQFVKKHQKIFRLKESDLKRSSDWMTKRGGSAVFVCRFVPVVRSLISIPAGAAHMRFWQFLTYTTLGTAIWNTILIYLGALAGNNWQRITGYINTYSYFIAIAVSLTLVFLIIGRVMQKKRKKNAMVLSQIENSNDNVKCGQKDIN